MKETIDSYNSLVGKIKNRSLMFSCKSIEDDLCQGYGAESKHHAYKGGLLVHTAQVMEHGYKMAQGFADTDVVITACAWHDYGKLFDYDEFGKKTSHKDYVRHVVRSYHEFLKFVNDYCVIGDNLIEPVAHCILAHHGRKEWGSPVEPISKEAHIVHYADMLSSRFQGEEIKDDGNS